MHRVSSIRSAIALLAGILLTGLVAAVHAQSAYIPLQGQLTKQNVSGGANTSADDGVYTITVRVYKIATGGPVVWNDTFKDLPVINGVFNMLLGSQTPLSAITLIPPDPSTHDLAELLRTQGVLYVGVTITEKNGIPVSPTVEMLPRLALLPVAASLTSRDASNADLLDGKHWDLFFTTGNKAKDADQLDGRDWTDILQSGSDPTASGAQIKASLLPAHPSILDGFTLDVGLTETAAKGKVVQILPRSKTLTLANDIAGFEHLRHYALYLGNGAIQVTGSVITEPGIVVGGTDVVNGHVYYVNDQASTNKGLLKEYSSSPTRYTAVLAGYGIGPSKLFLVFRPQQLLDVVILAADQGNLLTNPSFTNQMTGWPGSPYNSGGGTCGDTGLDNQTLDNTVSNSQTIDIPSYLWSIVDAGGIRIRYGAKGQNHNGSAPHGRVFVQLKDNNSQPLAGSSTDELLIFTDQCSGLYDTFTLLPQTRRVTITIGGGSVQGGFRYTEVYLYLEQN